MVKVGGGLDEAIKTLRIIERGDFEAGKTLARILLSLAMLYNQGGLSALTGGEAGKGVK